MRKNTRNTRNAQNVPRSPVSPQTFANPAPSISLPYRLPPLFAPLQTAIPLFIPPQQQAPPSLFSSFRLSLVFLLMVLALAQAHAKSQRPFYF